MNVCNFSVVVKEGDGLAFMYTKVLHKLHSKVQPPC